MRRKPLSKRGQRTGLEVVEEIKAGVGCDIGYGCLEYETKFTEFDPRLRGLEVVQQTMGWGGGARSLDGEWRLTGYSIFSYSGHSALYEAEREEGEPKKAWLSEWKPKGGYGAIPECVEPFEEPANGAILYRRDEKEFVGGRFGDNPVRVRIARTFFGVRLPRFTDWWDVRTDEKTRTGSNPERDEGVKAQYFLKSSYDGATPTSCQHYADSCKRGFSHHSAKEVQDIRDRLAEMWWKWRKAHRKPARHGQGGGVVYAPVWVEFGNYGWSIHSLEKMGVVEQSRSEAWMFWRDEGKDEGGKGK